MLWDKQNLEMRKYLVPITTAVYLIAAVVFFAIPSMSRISIWIPVALLAVTCAASNGQYRWLGALALAASAVGDVFGGRGMLLPQIGSFTIAQILYAVIFISIGKWNARRIPMALIPLAIAAVVGSRVLPNTSGVFTVGLCVYITVIVAMSVSAMFVERKGWWMLVVGVLLFVLSDSVIAWNLFVERIPRAGLIIMTTYYAAQALLWSCLVRWTDKEVR